MLLSKVGGWFMDKRQKKYYDALVVVAEGRGFTVTGTYVNNRTPIVMLCPNGHEIEIPPSCFKRGRLFELP